MSLVSIEHFGDETFTPREPLATGEYAVPNEIEIVEDALVWRYSFSASSRPYIIVTPKASMLPQFIAIRAASNSKIVAYVKRWGVLSLCKEHWMPASHNPFCEPSQSEPLSEWRFLARKMWAFLEIASLLDGDETGQKLGRREDWRVLEGEDYLGEFFPGSDLPHWEEGWRATSKNLSEARAYEKSRIGDWVDNWLAIGGVRPRGEWLGDYLKITLEGGPGGKMFGALAIQLMQEVGRCTFRFCRGCQDAFRPEARQSRYCPACQKAGVPQQRAADRRNRKKSKPASA